jgi:Transposase DDE domain group 1
VKGSGRRSWPVVTTDGTGMVSHAGTALLRELAERTGLRAEYGAATHGLRRRGGGHDPGQVLVDLAEMLADGGEAIADVAALTDQPALHGPVASPATAWRVLAGIDEDRLADLRHARALTRQRVWLARADQTGRALPPARAGGAPTQPAPRPAPRPGLLRRTRRRLHPDQPPGLLRHRRAVPQRCRAALSRSLHLPAGPAIPGLRGTDMVAPGGQAGQHLPHRLSVTPPCS